MDSKKPQGIEDRSQSTHPVKIAISGKGGAGKTTLSVLLARAFAEEGQEVILIDADPDGNLPEALCVKVPPAPISEMKELIAERTETQGDGYGLLFKMNPSVSDIPEKYAVYVNGIRLLVLGTIESGGGGCACPLNVFLKSLLTHLVLARDEVVVVDMEAGIEHLGRATVEGIDWLVVVVEPGLRSVNTARRVERLARELGLRRVVAVLNKIRSTEEETRLREALSGLEIAGSIPYYERLIRGDQQDGSCPAEIGGILRESVEKVRENLRRISR